MNEKEIQKWMHTLDVKGRNHVVGKRRSLYLVEGICSKCGKLLSTEDNCFIAVFGKPRLREALKAKFKCFDCGLTTFIDEYCGKYCASDGNDCTEDPKDCYADRFAEYRLEEFACACPL